MTDETNVWEMDYLTALEKGSWREILPHVQSRVTFARLDAATQTVKLRNPRTGVWAMAERAPGGVLTVTSSDGDNQVCNDMEVVVNTMAKILGRK